MWWFVFVSAAWSSCSSPGAAARLPPLDSPFTHESRIEGMVARWRVDGDHWVVQLEAQTTGWVVFGTSTTSSIVGADLRFAWFDDVGAQVAHPRVIAPGHHVPVASPRVSLLAAHLDDGGTTVRLRVPAPPLDRTGSTWLVLAWSRSPALDHHSAVREHVRVSVRD